MRYTLCGLVIFLYIGCTSPNPTEEKPDDKPTSKITVSGFEPQSANPGDFIRISGSGFDTNVVVRLADLTIPIDTLRKDEIVVRAPWTNGIYKLTVGPWDAKVIAGDLTVTHRVRASVQIEEGWYRVVSMQGRGASNSSGWRVWNSAGEGETFTSSFDGERTTGINDEMPWVQIIGDSIIGRSHPVDAEYFGMIDRVNSRVMNFRGKLLEGNQSTGFFSIFTLSARDLEVEGAAGKYTLRANGLSSFDTMRWESNEGYPRPSRTVSSYFTTPNSFVELVLVKDK